MAFHNTRLPVDIERGASGGPEFRTTVISLSSGQESRNARWSRPRLSWDIGYGIQNKSDLEAVIEFFYARMGMAHGFRFKDWSDYRVDEDSTDTYATLAAGDDTTTNFQIYKFYTSGGVTFARPLTRLVANTLRVFIDTTEQTVTTHYTIDIDTGIISFVSAPTSAETISIICEFDTPVRFDTDKLDLQVTRDDAISIPSIPIRELREELGSLS